MATTLVPVYGTATTVTITLASLASNAGRSSVAIDNTVDLACDAIIGGKITVGSNPATRPFNIWLYASYDGVSYDGGITGVDATVAIQTGVNNREFLLFPFDHVMTSNTANQLYTWGNKLVAPVFGGVMPKKWGVYVANDTASAFNATAANFETKYTPIQYQMV